MTDKATVTLSREELWLLIQGLDAISQWMKSRGKTNPRIDDLKAKIMTSGRELTEQSK